MRLAFLPIKRNSPFGGSEVLWAKTAGYAVEQGHAVDIYPYQFKVAHSGLQSLRKAGANVFFRETRNLTTPLRNRVKLKVNALLDEKFNRINKSLKPIVERKPDLLIINQGSWFDLADDEELMRVIRLHNIPFFVICHSFQDNGLLTTNLKLKILDMYKRAKHVFFVGERQRQVIEKSLMYRIEKYSIILNPLNISGQGFLPFKKGVLRFAMVSSLITRWKGHDVLLETLALPKWRERDWELVIYGEGEDKPEIARLIDFYELNKRVQLSGYCKDIRDAFANAHALIMPSRVEAAPLTLYEAMLCGRPAVVTNIGDMGRVIKEGYNGFVAEAAHPDSLDKALDSLWSSRGELEILGQNALNSVKNQFRVPPEEVFLEKLIKVAED